MELKKWAQGPPFSPFSLGSSRGWGLGPAGDTHKCSRAACARVARGHATHCVTAKRDIARYCEISRNIARYCEISQDIVRYREISQDIARYCDAWMMVELISF